MSIVIHNCEQGSPEWHACRLGLVTASEIECLLVKGKADHGFGVGAITYMDRLIGERITGEAAELPFETQATRRGHELEKVALDLYAQDNPVSHAGFITNFGGGYSPDGLVGPDGLVEIKTKIPAKLIPIILSGEFPEEHKAQCQFGLLVTGRSWIDIVVYWPGMPMVVRRAYRDEPYLLTLATRLQAFLDFMDARQEAVMSC